MNQNLISLNFTATDVTAIDTAFKELESRLAGPVSLSPDDRISIRKMGSKSENFCRQTLVALAQNPGVLTANFGLPEAQRDLANNVDLLRPFIHRLTRLLERAEDSEIALGSDVMSASLTGYEC